MQEFPRIEAFSDALTLESDGIWHAAFRERLSYPSEGYGHCFAVEDGSYWFRHRSSCIVEAVKRYPCAGPLFDIGGGNGRVAMALIDAGIATVLVEPGIEGARNAKDRGVSTVICASLTTAGFKPGALPAVGLFDVIEHIGDDAGFIRSVHAILQPDGMLYATVPAYSWLWSKKDVQAGHYRRYHLAGISDLLTVNGFGVVFATHIFRPLPPVILLLRTLPSRMGFHQRSNNRSVARDHAVAGGVVSRLMDRVLQPEVDRVRRGIPMTFGGSCMVVARKV